MRRTAALGVLAAIGFAQAPAQDATFPPLPSGSYVRDEAGVVSQSAKQDIDGISSALVASKGYPIAVAVIKSLAQYNAQHLTIEQYARMLFDYWGPGSQTNNRGMLLLVSLEDRRARIELGAGWMGSADSDTQAVMDGMIIPEFKKGDYSQGILVGVRGMQRIANGEHIAPAARGLHIPFPDLPSADPTVLLYCISGPFALLARFLRLGDYDDYDGGSSGFSEVSGGFSGGSGGGGGASGSW